MGFYNKKYNNADGRDPDFGAIFMSNSGTKRECFERRLLGLPSPEIQFVEQVKAGMILFLFEYEKKQLHGVFKATCDGAMNIVPNAFSSSGKHFPAQVKFTEMWRCKPLPESLFRDAIRENYFSANKFNFGLSEKQVYKLLYLFSKRKLKLEVPRPTISGQFPSDKIRVDDDDNLSVSNRLMNDRLMSEDLRKNGQRMVFSADIPGLYHSNVNPSVYYSEPFLEPDYLVQTHIRPTSPMIHPTEAQISNNTCSTREDVNSKSTFLYDPDAPGIKFKQPSSTRINNRSRSTEESASPLDYCRWNSLGNEPGLMHMELEDMNRGHHVGYGFPNRGPYGSNRDCIPFNSARNSDQFASESVIFEAGNSLPSLKSSSAPYPPPDSSGRVDEPFPSLIHNYKSCVARNSNQLAAESVIYEAGNSIPSLKSSSPPVRPADINGRVHEPFSSLFNNYKSFASRNSDQLAAESVTYDAGNSIHSLKSSLAPVYPPVISGRRYEPFSSVSHNYKSYAARNFDHLASKSVTYVSDNRIPSLKSSSAPVPPDIRDRVHEPFSSLFYNCKSCVGKDAHPIALRENQGYEMTLQKNNETFTPGVPSENEGHSLVQYDDPLIHGYDIKCYGNPNINKSGNPKQKGSVFSRLSSVQDVRKQKNGNNARNEEYDFDTAVDEVMQMAHQCHSQWLAKGKPKPLVNNAEILKDRTKIVNARMKIDCFENTLKNVSKEVTPASEGNTNETAEETPFVDFKRRSKVRKLGDENEIRSSNESEKSEDLVLVSQKRRKLIRPNFSKSTISDDKGIDLGASQNLEISHESFNLEDVSESCCPLVYTKDNIKTNVEVQTFSSKKHSEDKSISLARGYVCSEGGGQVRDGVVTAFNDGSECPEKIDNQNAFSEASCKDKTYHIKNLELESLLSVCQERYVDNNVIGSRGVNIEGAMSQDGSSSFTGDGNEKAPIETSHIKEGLGVGDVKSVCKDTESLHSICEEH